MDQLYFSTFKDLSRATGICVPTLRKLVNRSFDPLPAIKVSPRKYVFVPDQVNEWFKAEAERQAGGEH